jgi:RNase P/RNase MRP subunit POP5
MCPVSYVCKEKIGVLFGDVGSGGAAALTKVCFYDPHSSILIIRVSRDYYRKILLALACVTHIKGLGVTIRCLQVSSTGRTCIKGMKAILSTGESTVDLAAVQSVL